MPDSLSVVVIARDEEERIGATLASVRFAGEILVIDTGSTDRTAQVAESLGAKVHRVPWVSFAHAKQSGIERASGDWILSLDADERLSPRLARSVEGVLEGGAAAGVGGGMDGFRVARRSIFLGREMRGGGWYPDRVLRLFRRGRGRVAGGRVHERIEVAGRVGDLEGEILHDPYRNLEHYVAKLDLYSGLAALDLAESGKRAGVAEIAFRPAFTFFRMLVLQAGLRDGMRGFLLASLSALAVLVKYAKLWELGAMTGAENARSNANG